MGHFRKKRDVMMKFEKFVRDVVGKPYQISLQKLTQKHHQKGKGYFCSEIVARSLMELGVLTSDRSAAQYWPACFSSADLPVCEGACIDWELLIDYDTLGLGGPI